MKKTYYVIVCGIFYFGGALASEYATAKTVCGIFDSHDETTQRAKGIFAEHNFSGQDFDAVKNPAVHTVTDVQADLVGKRDGVESYWFTLPSGFRAKVMCGDTQFHVWSSDYEKNGYTAVKFSDGFFKFLRDAVKK